MGNAKVRERNERRNEEREKKSETSLAEGPMSVLYRPSPTEETSERIVASDKYCFFFWRSLS